MALSMGVLPAVSSILNLRRPRTDRMHGMGFVDFTASGGYLEGKFGNDTQRNFFVGGRYSYLGQLLKIGADIARKNSKDGDVPPAFSTAPTYYDLNLSYHDERHERLKFSLITLISKDKVVSTREDGPEHNFLWHDIW